MMDRRLINALFAAAALLTPACGTLYETGWYRVAPPLEPEWVPVSVDALRAVCGEAHTQLRNRACVVRRLDLDRCFIFSVAPPSEFSDEDRHHEEDKHCREGLNHD